MKGHNLIENVLYRQQRHDRSHNRCKKILSILKDIRQYSMILQKLLNGKEVTITDESSYKHTASSAITTFMKLSFEVEYRRITVWLGGLEAISELLVGDLLTFGQNCPSTSIIIRRFSGMALTNLTFGDIESKRILCSIPRFLSTAVDIINSEVDQLKEVYASVIRNLSWKSDMNMKQLLQNSQVLESLMKSAMTTKQEAALKSVLSAIWNLSSHCQENKRQICACPGALAFLISLVNPYRNSMAIVENASGILKYVSSTMVDIEEYRTIVMTQNIFPTLIALLQSTSLTVVKNTCAILYNLCARNLDDQHFLIDLGAVPMLQSLINSRHLEIAQNAWATLRNLTCPQCCDVCGGMDGSLIHRQQLKTASLSSSPIVMTGLNHSVSHQALELVENVAKVLPLPSSVSQTIIRSNSSSVKFSTNNVELEGISTKTNGEKQIQQDKCRRVNASSHELRQLSDYEEHYVTIDLTNAAPGVRDETKNILQIDNDASFDLVENIVKLGQNKGEMLNDSILCTRSTSMQSLSSEMREMSSFHSTVHSSCSTRRMSPINMDDIPDSPTMPQKFTMIQVSDAISVQEDLADYGSFEPVSTYAMFLSESINAAMPIKKESTTFTTCLDQAILSVMPKPNNQKPNNSEKYLAATKPIVRSSN